MTVAKFTSMNIVTNILIIGQVVADMKRQIVQNYSDRYRFMFIFVIEIFIFIVIDMLV